MRHALAPHWIPPRPQRKAGVAFSFLPNLREAGMAAVLALGLSWGLGELLLLIGV